MPVPTLTTLEVDENGTYTAPSGTAYNEVEVDVPLPENAYLLKDIENTPTAIATFSDGANLPMPKLEVEIEPVQSGSGDPSPTNIRPISGWDEVNVSVSGVNVWDEEWELGYLDGGNGQPTTEPTSIRSKNFNGCVPNTNYYGSIPTESAGSAYYIYWYDADKNYISRDNIGNATKMSPSSAIYFKLACYHYGTTYNNDISINYPSSDTSYHAYNGQTYTIDLDGTRYGGKVDLVSGVMTVDRAYVEYDGSNDEAWGNYSSNYKGFPITISDSKIDATNPSTQLMCDKLAVSTVRGPSGEKQIKTYTSTSDNNAIFVSIEDITDKADFLTYLSNNIIEIVYPLATPLTIQLPPTPVISLDGVNNVSADSGDVIDGKYFSKEE